MSDTKSGDDKTLSVNAEEDLDAEAPRYEQGTVRQNFSHGRTKAVVVETKKRKFSLPGRQAGAGRCPCVRLHAEAAGRGSAGCAGSAQGAAASAAGRTRRHGAQRVVAQ